MQHFKTTASIIVLFLILAPLVSFAKNIQSGQASISGQAGINKSSVKIQNSENLENSEIPKIPEILDQGIKAQNTNGLQNNKEEKQQNKIQTGQNAQDSEKIIKTNIEDTQKGKGYNQASDKAIQRRSMVANAIQGMLKVAEDNQGVGKQIRVITQSQNQNQEKIETEIKEIKNRGRLKKFFFGPNYKKLNSVEDRIANHEQKLEELKQIATQITNKADATKLQKQIKIMEQVKIELEKEVIKESKGFSLFGWLNKMFSK